MPRSQLGLDGTGVTIGTLSDSVNQYQGGLEESYSTGDLNPNNPVTVLQDGPGNGTDEGRAMLEDIHDIAPGANLQFATGDDGEVGFMNNIEALTNAGSKVIVDDIGYLDEPMFQDGYVSQGVDYATCAGRPISAPPAMKGRKAVISRSSAPSAAPSRGWAQAPL